MIPNNQFTASPVLGVIRPPYVIPYEGLFARARGGIALNDASQGRDYQNWTIIYSNGFLNVAPEGAPPQLQVPAVGVLSVSLGFDGNMAPVIAYRQATQCRLYFYSVQANDYVYLDIVGGTSCAVVLDDNRSVFLSQSDVLFFYTLAGMLYWRQQRDSYAISYPVGPSGISKIYRAGMSSVNRIQVELK